jgi:hypothetical protein
MGLYKNIVQWNYNIEAGEHVAWVYYPFKELKIDPIFKVLSIDLDTFKANLEVVASSFLVVGTQYLNQPLDGFRRVKLTSISNDFTYAR